MSPRRSAYDVVRSFFEDGPPASRNLAYEAYQDPVFARAVRIYQYLCNVRDQLVDLMASGGAVQVEVLHEEERVVLRLRYERGQLRRTAYLRPEEWRLLREEPALRELLPKGA
jgi:hypothetical protein